MRRRFAAACGCWFEPEKDERCHTWVGKYHRPLLTSIMVAILILVAARIAHGSQPVVPPAPKTDPAIKLTPIKPVTVPLGKKIVVKVETTAKKVTWSIPAEVEYWASADGKTLACWADIGTYNLTASVPSGDDVLSTVAVLRVTGPRPPPGPGPINPNPPTPPTPPTPVISFRVIWVTESADTLTSAQVATMDSKQVRDYLTANTTKESDWAGWRRYDKNENATNELPNMKALWTAVQPKITTTPCVVVEVNGKADILPFPTSAADALATFKKYNGGK